MGLGGRTGGFWATAVACCAAGLLFAPLLGAQTVRPVIAEYQGKARGRFDLVNDSVVPLNVVLETKSFSISDDGSPAFRSLDKEIHLKLSQMSFRIPPRQTYYVFYEATADQYPAWFVIYATFAGLPKQAGLNVQVELPHTVYMLQKGGLQQQDIRVDAADYLPDSKQVAIEIENTGGRYGRVTEIEVRAGREKSVHAGFPLMPQSRRRLRMDWKSAAPPQKLVVHFRNFKVESPLQERRN